MVTVGGTTFTLYNLLCLQAQYQVKLDMIDGKHKTDK